MKKQQSDFAKFFLEATEKEKRKLFLEVAKKANEDQLKILNK